MSLMNPLRDEIDAIDRELIALLSRRLKIVDEVVKVKTAEGLPVRIPARIDEVMQNAIAEGERLGVPEALVRHIWAELIEQTCLAEERLLGRA